MILVSGLLVLLLLVWLSLPPRDGARWALALGWSATVAWLFLVALHRGLAAELGPRGPLWLSVLALAGAPLIQLLVWSAVAFATRPRVPERPPGAENE